jgi:hypothetical protein
MLTEDQHPLEALQQAIRQASWDLYFAKNPVCETPDFVEDPGLELNDILEERPLLILSRATKPSPTRGIGSRGEAATLPITLVPENVKEFLDSLLLTMEAWIEVSYSDGHKETRRWLAKRMQRSSNVIDNLRSRPEFRAGNWQKEGIVSLRVTIEHPNNLNR